MAFLEIKKSLPQLGVGLGLRRELAVETFANGDKIDWLEIIPENYMELGGAARERLDAASACFPLVTHGVNLSIGSTDDLNQEYLSALKKLLDKIDAPWWSDHLCFTSCDGVYMQDLLPLPFSKEASKHISSRIKYVQDFVQRPFLLENISFYMNVPGAEMSETEFFSQILEDADCGLLLDVNNVYVNSINHTFDPYRYLDQLPLERVVQIHVAGHKRIDDYLIDTHGSAVIEPVYELLEYVLQKTEVQAIMLERDQNYPDFAVLLDELSRLRQIANATGLFLDRQKLLGHKLNASESINLERIEEISQRGREVRALSA
ncbi:MAG: DUF692 domain-containing protein [Candidatus Obscuribacterales bacterium]|nr:DUF692 domain-containing protein [Candidatus Obscuribacterales bacterium]